MKWNININQKAIVDLKVEIDIIDAAILDQCLSFSRSPDCEKMFHQGDVYYWFGYKNIEGQLPLIKLKKDSIYRRLKKMVDVGLLKPHPNNQTIGKPLYSFTDLCHKCDYGYKSEGTDENPKGYGPASEGVRMKIRRGTDENPDYNSIRDNTINDNTIKDKTKSQALLDRLPELSIQEIIEIYRKDFHKLTAEQQESLKEIILQDSINNPPATKNVVEEQEAEEAQEAEYMEEEPLMTPEDQRFEDWWNAYDNKKKKELARKKWNRLNEKEKQAAEFHTPQYVELEAPDKTYRQHPTTYLHQKTFNDEITPRNKNGKGSKPAFTEDDAINEFAKIKARFGGNSEE